MAAIPMDTTVVAGDGHVTTRVEDELVLLNDETGTYQGLTGIGPRVWELVQEPTTVRAVVETVAGEYDVDRDRCERDIRAFLGELADEGLVEVDGPAP